MAIKLLSVSTDRNIFKNESAVKARMIEYARLFEEFHIIVFTKKGNDFKNVKLAPNAWVYPTNSFFRFQYMKDALKLARNIIISRKFSYDNSAVTVQDPFETGLVGAKIKKIHNLPFQVQVHTDPWSSYFKKLGILNRIRVHIAKSVIPKADLVRVVSERLKKSLISETKIAAEKIVVLPIYINAKKFAEAPITMDLHKKYLGFKFIILVVARLTAEKNIQTSLEVLSRVLKIYPHTGLVIVGDGPELSNLKLKTKKLGIEASVVFVRWQDDTISYYKSSNLLLNTSFFEGYGRVLLEAAATGMPIITSDVGIVGEILIDKRSAMVCPSGDTSCFFLKTVELIKNNAMRQYLGNNARTDVEKKIGTKEAYLNAYQSALESIVVKQK